MMSLLESSNVGRKFESESQNPFPVKGGRENVMAEVEAEVNISFVWINVSRI